MPLSWMKQAHCKCYATKLEFLSLLIRHTFNIAPSKSTEEEDMQMGADYALTSTSKA